MNSDGGADPRRWDSGPITLWKPGTVRGASTTVMARCPSPRKTRGKPLDNSAILIEGAKEASPGRKPWESSESIFLQPRTGRKKHRRTVSAAPAGLENDGAVTVPGLAPWATI